jgi:prepilin peptidase CpaA
MVPFLVAAVVVALVAAYTDWKTGEIPNWLTFGTLGVAPIAHVVRALTAGVDTKTALMEGAFSICGALLCGLVPMMLYSKDAIGGGDVKLFAALGALCRPMIGVEAEMYGFFAAALIAPARLAYEGKLFRTLKNAALLMVNPFLPKDKKHAIEQEMMTWFRMGPAIFVGMVITAFLHWRQP